MGELAHESGRNGVSVVTIAERLKERIYAGLTVLAVITGLVLSGSATHVGAAVAVTATVVGLWLATIAAELQAHRAAYGKLATRREVAHVLYVSAPLITAAIGPLILIGLSALGFVPLVTALYIAAGIDAAELFAWGLLSGVRMKAGLFVSFMAGLVNLGIGILVVAVKLIAGH